MCACSLQQAAKKDALLTVVEVDADRMYMRCEAKVSIIAFTVDCN
jgi:hypothetical protein